MAAGIGGAIGGFGKLKRGKAMEEAGNQGVAAFKWDDLTNPYEDQAVSTLGADLRTEQANVNTATNVEALRGGGARSLAAGMGRVQAANTVVSADIAANLDEAQKAIDLKAAGQTVNNAAITEKRQADELAGFGNMIDVGMDMRAQGVGDLVAAGGAIDSMAMAAASGGMSAASGGMSSVFGAAGGVTG